MKRSIAVYVVSALLLWAHSLQAFCDEASDSDSGPRSGRHSTELDEVVVTATKRETPLLKVPLSIAAVTQDQIEELGVKKLEDLKIVPSLVVLTGDEQALLTVVIRGIGAVGTAATVSTYLDDTPLTFGGANPNFELFDLDRVEVLRGPQGTLFGSSAMGGSIRFVSPAPDYDQSRGVVKAETGLLTGGSPGYEGQVAVGTPLIPGSLAVRVSGFYRRDGGYIDLVNEDTGAVIAHNVNSTDTYGGRFAVSGRVADSVDATLSVLAQQRLENQLPNYMTGRGTTDLVPLPTFERVARVPDISRLEREVIPNLTIKARIPGVELTSSTSLAVRHWVLDDDFSYLVQRLLGLPDAVGRPLASPADSPATDRGWVQEIRVASSQPSSLKWLAGAYYRYAKSDSKFVVTSNLPTVVPELAPLLTLPGNIDYESFGTSESYEAALFGEVTWTVASRVNLTAGLRHSDLRGKSDGFADGFFNGGYNGYHQHSEQRNINSPKGSVSFQVTDDMMVYTTAARGFRPGGANDFIPNTPECQAELAALGRSAAPTSFESDSLWSYEVGAKGKAMDHRLLYAMAAYDIEWSGLQQLIQLSGGCPFSYIDNVGKARSRGFEFESSWTPVDPVTFGLSLGYTDARLAQDLVSGVGANGPTVAAPRGTKLPNVPDWTGATSVEYRLLAGSRLNPYVHADYQFIGASKRVLGTPADDPKTIFRMKYSLASVRLGATVAPSCELNLFANNLFNQHPVIHEAFGGFSPGPSSTRTTILPRYFGISVSKRF